MTRPLPPRQAGHTISGPTEPRGAAAQPSSPPRASGHGEPDIAGAVARLSNGWTPPDPDKGESVLARGMESLLVERPAGKAHPVTSIGRDDEPVYTREEAAKRLPDDTAIRVRALGVPDIEGDPYAQRMNCVTVTALIRVALEDFKFPKADEAHLREHMRLEYSLASQFKQLGEQLREKGIYR